MRDRSGVPAWSEEPSNTPIGEHAGPVRGLLVLPPPPLHNASLRRKGLAPGRRERRSGEACLNFQLCAHADAAQLAHRARCQGLSESHLETPREWSLETVSTKMLAEKDRGVRPEHRIGIRSANLPRAGSGSTREYGACHADEVGRGRRWRWSGATADRGLSWSRSSVYSGRGARRGRVCSSTGFPNGLGDGRIERQAWVSSSVTPHRDPESRAPTGEWPHPAGSASCGSRTATTAGGADIDADRRSCVTSTASGISLDSRAGL